MNHTAHASQPHTLPSRSKSQPHDQNLSKSASVPTHSRHESAANFKDNKTDDKERQCTTSYIKHLAVSGLSSISARIKSSCNLTEKCFEMPNVSYT
ncbi:hypothetical protein DSECCO2_409130 [anaerobic digester metagenome]